MAPKMRIPFLPTVIVPNIFRFNNLQYEFIQHCECLNKSRYGFNKKLITSFLGNPFIVSLLISFVNVERRGDCNRCPVEVETWS